MVTKKTTNFFVCSLFMKTALTEMSKLPCVKFLRQKETEICHLSELDNDVLYEKGDRESNNNLIRTTSEM